MELTGVCRHRFQDGDRPGDKSRRATGSSSLVGAYQMALAPEQMRRAGWYSVATGSVPSNIQWGFGATRLHTSPPNLRQRRRSRSGSAAAHYLSLNLVAWERERRELERRVLWVAQVKAWPARP